MADFIEVARLDEVPRGKGAVVSVAGKDVALFDVDGTIYPMEDACRDYMANCSMDAWSIPEAPLHPTTPSDDALVESAKMGCSGAFAQLIDRYQRYCMLKAYSILRNRSDAEDEVQSAWVQAWTNLESYRGQGFFCAWLSRILSNRCLMRLRKARRAPMTSLDEVFSFKAPVRLEVIDQRALPEQMVGDVEVLRVVNKEIRSIPLLLREVLIKRDLGQLDIRDIAADLGISQAAARSRLMRARIELKKRLERHHGEKGFGTLLQRPCCRTAAYVRTNRMDS